MKKKIIVILLIIQMLFVSLGSSKYNNMFEVYAAKATKGNYEYEYDESTQNLYVTVTIGNRSYTLWHTKRETDGKYTITNNNGDINLRGGGTIPYSTYMMLSDMPEGEWLFTDVQKEFGISDPIETPAPPTTSPGDSNVNTGDYAKYYFDGNTLCVDYYTGSQVVTHATYSYANGIFTLNGVTEDYVNQIKPFNTGRELRYYWSYDDITGAIGIPEDQIPDPISNQKPTQGGQRWLRWTSPEMCFLMLWTGLQEF